MTQDLQTPTLVEQPSAFDFPETLQRIVAAIESKGLRVFAQIDHAAGAAEVGLSMPPTTVLVYGHPKGGTPMMLAAPRSALDLPLHLLVRVDADGSTRVAFHPVAALLVAAGVPADLAAKLAPAQALVLAAIQG